MNNLQASLAQLVSKAQAAPGQPQRLTLRRGLRVDVLISGEKTLLQISRVDAQPSDRELKIVLRDWPGTVPASAAANVKRTDYAGRRRAGTAGAPTVASAGAAAAAPWGGEAGAPSRHPNNPCRYQCEALPRRSR